MEEPVKRKKTIRQRFFVARELQLSIAILVVLALLGGIFLQSLAASLSAYFSLETPTLGIVLVVGYMLIIVFLSLFFTHRLVGPFKRLEYEMKYIKAGALDRRLSVRGNDDLHVKNFIHYVNDQISDFNEMSRAYNKLNSTISLGLSKAMEDLSREGFDRETIKKELKILQMEIHRYREKW